jgi:CRISPR-associated protein Cmr4
MRDTTHPQSAIGKPQSRILYLFTRTSLHVGAGASVGAIDQPIIRERHTGFPMIPATSLKGTFADQWPTPLRNEKGEIVRVVEYDNAKDKKTSDEVVIVTKQVEKDGKKEDVKFLAHDSAWLFGSDTTDLPFAGSLVFSEARLLAFPIRSAKGSFAWITCPLMLRRAARDGVLGDSLKNEKGVEQNRLLLALGALQEPADETAMFDFAAGSKLALGDKVVLEEYTFSSVSWPGLSELGRHLASLLPTDEVWKEIASRLVILSDGMMSFFAQNACEVAQHVKISDETGTAEGGALFNQENVPSETLFYSVLHAFDERTANKAKDERRDGGKAIGTFETKIKAVGVFQFGGDASTGLGYCTVSLKEPVPAAATTTI